MPPPDFDALADVPAFATLPLHVREALAEQASELSFGAGDHLIRAGEPGDSLFVLRAGRVAVEVPVADGAPLHVGTLGPGGLLGELQVVVGGERVANVIALEPTRALRITTVRIDALAVHTPALLANLAALAATRLHRNHLYAALRRLSGDVELELLQQLESVGMPCELEPGEYLFREGDDADAWYVVTSGRVEALVRTASGEERVAKIGLGELVGELAMVTDAKRTASIRALRQTTLVRFSKATFHEFLSMRADFARAATRTIVERLLRRDDSARRPTPVLVLVRGDRHPDTEAACEGLRVALLEEAGAQVLTPASFAARLGRPVNPSLPAGHPIWARFLVWLNEIEATSGVIVLDAGDAGTQWMAECAAQADACVWITRSSVDGAVPRPTEAATFATLDEVRALATRGRPAPPCTLVLVHPTSCDRPTGTAAWLEARPFARHLHVRLGSGDTMARAARLLTGRAYGVALGGGGARGFAHIGALRALEESGVPIDVIAGTSIGAIVGAQYCLTERLADVTSLNRRVIRRSPFTEYTLPVVAFLRSIRADAGVEDCFRDVLIEDLWRPFIATAVNLTSARLVVIERGLLRNAARASSSLPGALVPVVEDGHLLVDGGLVNNLPVDLVAARAGGPVIAVNVSPADDLRMPLQAYPSPWKLLWEMFVRFCRRLRAPREVRLPLLGDILARTMTVASIEHTETARRAASLLIEPHVGSVGMLEYQRIDEIVQLGYDEARQRIAEWDRAEKMPEAPSRASVGRLTIS